MPGFCRTSARLAALASTLIVAAMAMPARAEAPAAPAPACTAPAEFAHFSRALPHVAARLAVGGALKIVAIGSSSTAGAGASSSAASYPARLQAVLRAKYSNVAITVLNRGVNGEEVRDMLARLDRAVFVEKPDLVIWQLGSNSVLRDHDSASYPPLIDDGIRRMKAAGADVLLMDPQFAPALIAKAGMEPMLRTISMSAKESRVDVFHRFAVMRHWREDEKLPFTSFLAPDQLHMNDWGYNCVAHLLADAIDRSVTRIRQTASVHAPLH